MTRTEIEGLSGRELDVAVAVALFGWKVEPTQYEGVMRSPDGRLTDAPYYSADWCAMRLIVTRLTAMAGDDGDHLCLDQSIGSMFTLAVLSTGTPALHAVVEGPPETAVPTAVCRLALLMFADDDAHYDVEAHL